MFKTELNCGSAAICLIQMPYSITPHPNLEFLGILEVNWIQILSSGNSFHLTTTQDAGLLGAWPRRRKYL